MKILLMMMMYSDEERRLPKGRGNPISGSDSAWRVLSGPPGVVVLLRRRRVEHAELDEFPVHGAASVGPGFGVFTITAGADPPVSRSRSLLREARRRSWIA